MYITNSTNSYLTNEINSTKPIATANTTDKQNTAASTSTKSFDTFEYSTPNADIGTTYSANALNSNIATTEVSKIQTTSSTRSTISYYDVVINRAAQKAGVTVGANGVPRINNSSDAQKYQQALSDIEATYWCQTGGWEELSGDGSAECARTAIATMASINSGTILTPDDTVNDTLGMTVNEEYYSRTTYYNYDTNAGAAEGFSNYDLNSEEELIAAINNELKNNRSVVVHTNVSGGHWVTVTGTIDGQPAESFEDFIGVDPWYNGSNPNNPISGTGYNADDPNKSGVFQLSIVSGQTLNSDYRMMTFNIDN